MTHPTLILQTRALCKDFTGFRAVSDVELRVAEGTIHALVGPNGAGKTTLFHLLTGFLTPSSGQIIFDGREIAGEPPERIARLGVARSFQITSLFPRASVLEHVQLALQAGTTLGHRFWRSDRLLRRLREPAMGLLGQVGLTAIADRIVDTLAYGQKRALELAMALALEPRLLLLDEPTSGMGMEDVDRTVDLVRRTAAGRTVVMVEHNMRVVASLADTVTVLQRGSVLIEGSYDEVRSDPRVAAAYLGDAVA